MVSEWMGNNMTVIFLFALQDVNVCDCETAEMCLGVSEELQFFMSQCRKNSMRGKVIDKK